MNLLTQKVQTRNLMVLEDLRESEHLTHQVRIQLLKKGASHKASKEDQSILMTQHS